MLIARRFFILWVLIFLVSGPLIYVAAGYLRAQSDYQDTRMVLRWEPPSDSWVIAALSCSAGLAGLITLRKP